nr:50S ribosomal protein L11 methyltransferase [uncultured Desulfuromonas sp.]
MEIKVCVPVPCADVLCHELYELGSVGVVVEERPLDTFVPPHPDETDSDTFTIKAYFDGDLPAPQRVASVEECLIRLAEFFPGLDAVDVQVADVGQQDWAEGWKQHFQATRIGERLVIKPSWEVFAGQDNDVVVTLDPGMAFGTGTHGTTRLCLETLAALFDRGEAIHQVLDVGTGSGILAIAAAALGAEHVVACDIDPVACETARENCTLNQVTDRVEVTDTLLEELSGSYDVVLANILAEENIRLATALIERVRPGGVLILSGILEEKVALVTTAFSTLGLNAPDLFFDEEWACIQYRRDS